MQTFPRTAALRLDSGTSPLEYDSKLHDASTTPSQEPTTSNDGFLDEGGQTLQGRSYSATSPSACASGRPLAPSAPEGEAGAARALHHGKSSASAGERKRATTDLRGRAAIKRFPTIMTPSYGGCGGRPMLRQHFYSKTEKITVLSPDMEAKINEKICRALGKKYGSLERATQAVVTIQKAYRGYKLRKHFEEIRKEGNVQLSRRCSLDAKERKCLLTMVKDKAATVTAGDHLMVAEGDTGAERDDDSGVPGNTCQPAETSPEHSRCHVQAGSGAEVVVMRRSKSHSAVLTRRIREDDGEEEDEKTGENGWGLNWNRTVGVHLFNRKPASGIQYLISKGIIRDTPRSVAKFLREQDGLSKMRIGEFIGEIRYEFNMAVLEYLAHSIDMKDKPIDESLRAFQKLFLMPGEAQKIDKIMQIFAAEYFKVNKGVFETEDAVYVLSFSIMMLHTSLHNPSVKNKPSKEQWLKTNRGINNGGDFPKKLLLEVYDRIQKTQFVTGRDHTHQVMEIKQKLVGSDILKPNAPHRSFIDEFNVFELDKVNNWLKGKHKRTLLMFSDVVVVTKKNKDLYMFKNSFTLHDAVAVPFQTAHKHGIQVYSSVDKTLLFQCCCRTNLEYSNLFNNFNDAVKLLNVLEKERIAALQEQPHRHGNMIGRPPMIAGDFASVQAHSMAKSMDFLPGVGALQCSTETIHSLRPLSVTNLAAPLENLHLLDDVHKSGKDRSCAPRHRASSDEKENGLATLASSKFKSQTSSEQKTKDARLSLGKADRGLCGGDMDDVNPLIPYGSSVGVAIQV